MSFLYFIPFDSIDNRQALTPADFVALGLEHALANSGMKSVPLKVGPLGDGRPGLLAAVEGAGVEPVKLQYLPDQRWKHGPGGKWMVGVDTSKQPGPQQLLRPQWYDGAAVKLCDGNEWIIPRCWGLILDRGPTLPSAFDTNGNGELVARPHPKFAKLCKAAAAFGSWVFREDQESRTDEYTAAHGLELAVVALGVNYRVGIIEAIGLLNLFDSDNLQAVTDAIIDAPAILEWSASQLPAGEKKARDAGVTSGSGTSSGSPGATRDTSPASPPGGGSVTKA